MMSLPVAVGVISGVSASRPMMVMRARPRRVGSRRKYVNVDDVVVVVLEGAERVLRSAGRREVRKDIVLFFLLLLLLCG